MTDQDWADQRPQADGELAQAMADAQRMIDQIGTRAEEQAAQAEVASAAVGRLAASGTSARGEVTLTVGVGGQIAAVEFHDQAGQATALELKRAILQAQSRAQRAMLATIDQRLATAEPSAVEQTILTSARNGLAAIVESGLDVGEQADSADRPMTGWG